MLFSVRERFYALAGSRSGRLVFPKLWLPTELNSEGAEMNKLAIVNWKVTIVAIATLSLAVGLLSAGLAAPIDSREKPVDGGRAEEDGHSRDRINMTDARIAAGGIQLETARAATLSNTLLLNGLVRANQETLIQVTPRFPGIVRDIKKRIGGHTRKDDFLESDRRSQCTRARPCWSCSTPFDCWPIVIPGKPDQTSARSSLPSRKEARNDVEARLV